MGLLDWIKRKTQSVRANDLVWPKRAGTLSGIRETIRRRLPQDRLILLVSHFPDVFNELQDLLESDAADYQIIDQPLEASRLLELLDGDRPRLALAPANSLVSGEQAVEKDDAQRVSMIVAERHPIRSPDQAIEQFAASLPLNTRLGYFLSLEDAIWRRSASPVLDFLRQLGLQDDEAISGRLITSRLIATQSWIEKQVGSDPHTPAESAGEWFELNVPPEFQR